MHAQQKSPGRPSWVRRSMGKNLMEDQGCRYLPCSKASGSTPGPGPKPVGAHPGSSGDRLAPSGGADLLAGYVKYLEGQVRLAFLPNFLLSQVQK